jgi:hypothetical protein
VTCSLEISDESSGQVEVGVVILSCQSCAGAGAGAQTDAENELTIEA